MTPLINGADHRTAERFFGALDWWWDAAETWDDQAGETLCTFFVGRYHITGSPCSWRGTCQTTLHSVCPWATLTLCKGCNASASWSANGSPLPLRLARPHCRLPLTSSTCSWGYALWLTGLAPIRKWFPFYDQPDGQYMDRARSIAEYAIRKVGLDLSGQRAALASEGPGFSSLFQFSPDAIQQAAVDDTPLNERLAIIESETGSGKTEAALWRFAHMYCEGLVG